MVKILFGLIFFVVSLNSYADNVTLDGNWQLHRFDSINHVTGEMHFEELDEYYIFLDKDWVRIEKEESRHEYKYRIVDNYLEIGTSSYAILSITENEILLMEVFDIVGDYYIGTLDLFRLSSTLLELSRITE